MNQSVIFDTFTITRIYQAAVEKVYAAWSDPKARAIWGAPSDEEAIEYLEADFRVGGKDVSLCGLKGDMGFRIDAWYQHIEEPHRIVFTEHFYKRDSSSAETLLGISLITVELTPTDIGAEMSLTAQMSSMVGSEMISGSKSGWSSVANNLGAYLADNG